MKKRLLALFLVMALLLGVGAVAYAATGSYDFQMKTSVDGGDQEGRLWTLCDHRHQHHSAERPVCQYVLS